MIRFGPKRGHFMFIFERFFRDFSLLIVAVIVALILDDYQRLLDNIPLLVIVLFAPVKRLVDYIFTYYSIDDEKLLVESGWVKKKRVEIPLSNITTVDFVQNLVFQLAKVYSVKVDNASNVGSAVNTAEAKLTLKIEDAIHVKKLLLVKHGYTDEELYADRISEDTGGNTVVAEVREILLMGILRSKAVFVFQLLAFGAVALSVLSKIFMGSNVDGEDLIFDFLFSLSGPLLVGSVVISLYLVGAVASIVTSMIKYYGFRVTDRENSIFIEYGLLTKKTFTLMKDKVSGINFKQSLLMRAFGRGVLEVFAIGYGGNTSDEKQEIAILYPLLEKDKLHDFLQRLMPEIQVRQKYATAQRKALPYFFICPRVVCALLSLGIICMVNSIPVEIPGETAYGTWMVAIGIILTLVTFVSVVLEYFNTGIYGYGNTIGLSYGGFNKNLVFLKSGKVESIRERASMRKKRKKKITTIMLGVLAPKIVADQRVRNLSLEAFEDVKGKLIY